MFSFLQGLFSADFMPHVYCLREPGLIKLHAAADSVIALSYALIPLALLLLLRRRRDLAFPWIFALFGIFILGCGLTHVMGVVTLWHPIYRMDALIKAVTAVASILTAVLLFRLLPAIQALPSPAQLHFQIRQKETAQTALRELNRDLELRVEDRTAALRAANTELERANQLLHQSEERFRTLAEAVPNILWTRDTEGRATYVSPRYSQFTGLPADRLGGDAWFEAVHPEDRDRLRDEMERASAAGHTYDVEYRLRHHDGTYCWFAARAVPMRDQHGNITQWVGSSMEIDRLKRTEAALRRSNDELRQFAYVAAHDLQEPLRNVANAIGMLRRHNPECFKDGALKWLNVSSEGAQRMHEMVQDLLAYSRVVDESEAPGEIADTSAALAVVEANLASAIRDSGASLQVMSPLPRVRVSQMHFVQLLQNLISNAIKYRRRDVRPEIAISAQLREREYLFAVRDNGIGFDPEYAEKIFGVFKRLHLRDEYPGNGIGLAICARIVAHYGGKIWAVGEPGAGSQFFFTLPAA